MAVRVMRDTIHRYDFRAARDTLSKADAAKVITRICLRRPDLSVRAPQRGVKRKVIAGVMAPRCPICLGKCDTHSNGGGGGGRGGGRKAGERKEGGGSSGGHGEGGWVRRGQGQSKNFGLRGFIFWCTGLFQARGWVGGGRFGGTLWGEDRG